MPTLTRWFVKAALVCGAAALGLGAALTVQPLWPGPAFPNGLAPVYFHLLMVGWVTQLIFGVAHWMFPKASAARPRGDERLGWLVWGALNGGLVLRAIGEPWTAQNPGGPGGWLLAASAGLQVVAGWTFVGLIWPRVKAK